MSADAVAELVERAVKLMAQGRGDEAGAACSEILAIDPANADAFHMRAVLAYRNADHLAAIQWLERALEHNNSSAAMHSTRGEVYRALGELDRAALCYERAIELDPQFAPAYINYALALSAQGHVEQAKERLQLALGLNQASVKARFYLARLHLEDGDLVQAEAELGRCLESDPGHAEAHFQLGRARFMRGGTREAAASFSAALEIAPAHGDARMHLARALFELCHEAEARALLEQAQARAPGSAGSGAAAVRVDDLEQWCTRHDAQFTRLARPRWLRLSQPVALPAEESEHFRLPEPFVRSAYIACIDDARVLPEELVVLSPDNRVFVDGLMNFAEHFHTRSRLVQHCADDGRMLLSVPRRSVVAEDPCVLLGGQGNRFQWLYESLARLWAIEQARLQDLPLVVPQSLPPAHEQLLDMLGVRQSGLIRVPDDAVLQCRRLYVPSLLVLNYYVAPVAIQHLRRQLRSRVRHDSDAPRRLYLTRSGEAERRLSNEADLLPMLRGRGYTVVRPDALDIAEQLALFRSAESVIGFDDDVMASLFIMPAGASIGVIVPQGIYQPRHHFVAAALGNELTHLVADPDFASHAALARCDMVLAPWLLEQFLDRHS